MVVKESVIAVGEVACRPTQGAEVDKPVMIVFWPYCRTWVALGEQRRGASRSEEGECEEGGADPYGHGDLS